MKYTIDTTEEPFVPENHKLETNETEGLLEINIPLPKDYGEFSRSLRISQENSRLFRFLFEHVEIIPEEWKLQGELSFFGTKYINPSGKPVYIAMKFVDSKWCWRTLLAYNGRGWMPISDYFCY